MANNREHFATKLGFILMASGCAIGLGNIWRFPFITGKYGGGLFVLIYFIFLVIFGFPFMATELAIGRASQSTLPMSFRRLKNPATKFRWDIPGYVFFSGNVILLMFYTVVTGWLLAYTWYFINGTMTSVENANVAPVFGNLLSSPSTQCIFMLIGVLITAAICFGGLQKTVERGTKVLMGALFILLIALVIHSMTLPKAWDGVKFLLLPRLSIPENADWNYFDLVYDAMGQAFFTLSLGIGSISICGSYMKSKSSLAKESFWIILLDTCVAMSAGLIIFPVCFSYNIVPDAGPSLLFVTMPKAIANLAIARALGIVLFSFLSLAALSTLVACFENIVAFLMDEFKLPRKTSCLIYGVAISLLSLPCIFGFNIWSGFQPLGKDTNVLDLEDFIISSNMLPLGALYMLLFCNLKCGWGYHNFLAETHDDGRFFHSKLAYIYRMYILPVILFAFWFIGVLQKFA